MAGSGRTIGTGFIPRSKIINISLGGDGSFYVVRANRQLALYRHTGRLPGSGSWATSSGWTIGSGWTSNEIIIPNGDGTVYRQYAGRLYWYRHSDPASGAGHLVGPQDHRLGLEVLRRAVRRWRGALRDPGRLGSGSRLPPWRPGRRQHVWAASRGCARPRCDPTPTASPSTRSPVVCPELIRRRRATPAARDGLVAVVGTTGRRGRFSTATPCRCYGADRPVALTRSTGSIACSRTPDGLDETSLKR